MITSFSTITVVGLALTLALLLVQWANARNDAKAKALADLDKAKGDLNQEGKDALKNNDRGGIVNFLRRLRQSK